MAIYAYYRVSTQTQAEKNSTAMQKVRRVVQRLYMVAPVVADVQLKPGAQAGTHAARSGRQSPPSRSGCQGKCKYLER